MRIFALADLHTRRDAAEAAAKQIVAESAEAVLVAGDISHNDLDDAVNLLEILSETMVQIFFVPGNMDSPELSSWSRSDLKNLHGHCEPFGGYTLTGLGGSVRTPFNTPFELTEREVAQLLSQATSKCEIERLLLISHSPPKNTSLDRTRLGIHAGSNSVRQFIESKKPMLVVCGHIHEAQGIDKMGETVIVNPGPAYMGGYARVELNEKVQVSLARFKT